MMKKLGLHLLFLMVLLGLLASCKDDGIDDCSIPQELIENSPADAVPYTFTNRSCTTIATIYIAPRNCDYWGISWMGKDVLWPGESFTVYLPKGRYDVHFEDANGDAYFSYNEKIKAGGEFPIVNADKTSLADCAASVTIDNQSEQAITGFYIHRNGGLNWLGEGSIAPGEQFQFLMFPGTIDVLLTVGEFEQFYLETDVVVDHHILIEVTGD